MRLVHSRSHMERGKCNKQQEATSVTTSETWPHGANKLLLQSTPMNSPENPPTLFSFCAKPPLRHPFSL